MSHLRLSKLLVLEIEINTQAPSVIFKSTTNLQYFHQQLGPGPLTDMFDITRIVYEIYPRVLYQTGEEEEEEER